MRVNISLSSEALKTIDKTSKEFYRGNRSAFLLDAALEYSGKLNKRKNNPILRKKAHA